MGNRSEERLSPLVAGVRGTRAGFMTLFGSIPSPGGNAYFPDEIEEGYDMPRLVIDAAQRAALAARGYVLRRKRRRKK
jgi:hypothetical protein